MRRLLDNEQFDRLEKYIDLLTRGCEEERKRSTAEFEEKMSILFAKQNENFEALQRMEEEWKRRAQE